MTITASECQGISGSLGLSDIPLPILVPLGGFFVFFFYGWFVQGDGPTILYSILCAIGRFLRPLFRAILCAIGRSLRPLFRAIRLLIDRFSLGLAWFYACCAVLSSFLLFLVAWNGAPFSILDCWPVPVLCFSAWCFEQFYLWECKLDANYQAFQRGEL